MNVRVFKNIFGANWDKNGEIKASTIKNNLNRYKSNTPSGTNKLNYWPKNEERTDERIKYLLDLIADDKMYKAFKNYNLKELNNEERARARKYFNDIIGLDLSQKTVKKVLQDYINELSQSDEDYKDLKSL